MPEPRRKLQAPERIQDGSTDLEALKWFINRTESTGAVLLYWDEDDLDGLFYGRRKIDVQIGRLLFEKFEQFLREEDRAGSSQKTREMHADQT